METTESVEDWDVEMIRGNFFCFFYEFLGQTEVDAETQEPLPQLTAPCRDWCRAAGGLARAERVDDVLDAVRRGRLALAADAEAADAAADAEGARLVRALDAGLARANDRAVSNAQRVQKWTLLDADFSIAGGELGERERENPSGPVQVLVQQMALALCFCYSGAIYWSLEELRAQFLLYRETR